MTVISFGVIQNTNIAFMQWSIYDHIVSMIDLPLSERPMMSRELQSLLRFLIESLAAGRRENTKR